jgi:uncharacterized LabA/DUF88 family protein
MYNRDKERIGLFIDGANLYAASRALGFDMDYKRLLTLCRGQGYLVRAIYFAVLQEEHEHSPVRPLLDWLEYNGFSVVTKMAREFTDSQGRRRSKGSIDVEFAVNAMHHAKWFDRMILFCGEGDYRSLVAALQQMGKHVSVVSTLQSQPCLIADELRRQADEFVDLADLKPLVCREVARSGGVVQVRNGRAGEGHAALE